MMRNVLDTVLLVFDCDRAWLVYPCDPEAATWNVPMERTKPEYPGASAINLEVSMEATIAQVFRAVLSSNGPVKFGPGSKHPLPIMPADRFAVLSQIATAIYPKGDKPYCFGLHQCSHSRIWTGAEEMLLQEIARRLADSLSSLLAYRNLQESEEKYRTLIQNIQAAVVVHNSDTQISTSNAAAQELLGLTEDQMLGKTAWDPDWHFYREDGTVMPFEEYPANQVVATRKSLRDLIVGIHRPGNIQDVWVLASADPVFGADNEISRVIVTFMDITERKRVEERIQREVARTSVLLEIYEQAPKLSDKELYDFTLERAVQLTGSKIGFFHLVSEDQEQIILTSWNSEALKNCTAIYDTHYPLGQAGNWVDCVRYQRPVIYNDFPNSPHQKGLPEGHSPVRRFMSIPVMEDDKVRYIFGVGNKTEEYEDHDLDQILLVAYELSKILKQRRTEETLRKSEAELKEAQRVAQLGNWEWNVLTDTIKWSEECYRLCGFDPHQPVPGYEEHLKVYTPESMSKLDTAVKKALETGEPYELDLEIAHPVNNTQWIVARGRIIRDANGKIVGLGGTVQNITVRKRAEAEIARMNRALRMLSDSNQTLIRTTDEAALLDEVCKIAIETGGYRLAWIGIAEHDEAKNLRPVAHAGVDSGYIETAKISWDEESPRGKGPGGSAIRSGQPCIVRNIFSDPSFTPWRDEAIQRGYQSIIALPLISGSITYGAFGIYADQPDAFDEMEVEILKELAGDVAYGIGALRIRGEQKRAKQLLQESETRYRVVADNTYDWEFWINPAGMFNYVSPSVERITGYTVQEFMEDPDLYFRILHPEDQGSRRAHRDSVLQNPCPHSNEHEFRILHKDGSLRWIGHVCAPVYDQDGTFIGIRGSQRDITERKLMESALIQRDTEMGAIHDYAPVMMCMLDDERNLIRANRALEEFIEKPISESQREQGFGLLGCIHSSDHPKGCGFGLHCSDCPVNYALKETLDTGKSFRGLEWEFTLKRTGRTERFVFSISCSLFVLGTEKRLLLYVQDITKMTDAVEQLRRLNDHIDSVLEADRKWVAQEIHDDLGQQLTAMKMDIALARKRIPKDSAALSEKLDSMEKLTDSALESARKIAKRIRPIPLEIMDFTTALEWLANEISEHSEISCSLDIDTGDHTFSTKQSTILYRILQESLTNVVRHAEASHVDISLHIERGTLILRILDDGKGIDLEKANTYSSMGLTGMRERARFLGGDVSIKPLSQGGTVVNVQIPLTESEVSRD
ncbi:PAS domain S-box protein [bacterium]|nr:PAS domain S-box protein [bacterium]